LNFSAGEDGSLGVLVVVESVEVFGVRFRGMHFFSPLDSLSRLKNVEVILCYCDPMMFDRISISIPKDGEV
jgi:hypothetical protein